MIYKKLNFNYQTIVFINGSAWPIQLTDTDLGSFFIIDTSTYSANIYLPIISQTTAGATIKFVMSKDTYNILTIHPHVGANTLNNSRIQMDFCVARILMEVTSDGVNNWVISSSSTPASRANISTELIPEFYNNAEALAGGLEFGDIYRTVDIMKIVHMPE